jgi:hypothetical protein
VGWTGFEMGGPRTMHRTRQIGRCRTLNISLRIGISLSHTHNMYHTQHSSNERYCKIELRACYNIYV